MVFNANIYQMTGRVHSKFKEIESYFYLKKNNEALVKANEYLMNKIKFSSINTDSSTTKKNRSYFDTMQNKSDFHFISARVVSNSLSSQSNYIVLNKGSQSGIHEGMGVVSPGLSMVGIVTGTTDNYAVVMSLLHKDSRISGKLLKGGSTGIVNWNGADPDYITISNVSKSEKVYKGDTIISSGFSTAFPKGVLIGKIDALYKDLTNNYYKLKLKTTTDFHNLENVLIIENQHQKGVQDVIEKIKIQP